MYNIGTSTSLMFWGVLFIFGMHNYSYFRLGKMWRYQKGKQKPLMEGQTIQWRTRKMTKGQAMFFKSLHIYNQVWATLGLNVSVQTSYIYYWQVHFVFVLWLSLQPLDSMFLYRRHIFIINRYICIRLMTFVSPLWLNVSVHTWYFYYWQVHFVNNVITIKTKASSLSGIRNLSLVWLGDFI